MQKNFYLSTLILLMSPLVIGLLLVGSVLYGFKNIDLPTIIESITHFDSANSNHQIIMYSRIPRAIGTLLIGAFLAVSGSIMQGMTRNYLASPSIMGVSDGSAFAITLCMIFFPNTSSMQLIAFSFIGSALGMGLVFGIATLIPNGMSPVRLALLGTILGTFLSSVSAALANFFQVSQDISFWYNARVYQLNPTHIKLAIPVAIMGLLLSLMLSKYITILSMGEEIAISLGQNTKWIKIISMLTVSLLTGVSVALVGKIGFVGLIIPHITRFIVGIDYKRIIPCSMVLGGCFLILCDIVSRFINQPFETPIGIVTSLIGVPIFLYLARKKGGDKHA